MKTEYEVTKTFAWRVVVEAENEDEAIRMAEISCPAFTIDLEEDELYVEVYS